MGAITDRARGGADREPGSEDEFPPHRHPDGAGAVQVLGALVPQGEDSQGQPEKSSASSALSTVVLPFPNARLLTFIQIDKFPLHTVTDAPTASRLSTAERQYTVAHQALVSAHYHSSFLSEFPPALQRLDDTAGGISMVDTPDVDTAVFCRVLRDVGRVRQHATDSEFEMKKGDVWVVRWSLIKDRVFEGDIELI